MYVPIPVMTIAMIFWVRCFEEILSEEIFGKKTVKIIPITKTQIGWNESTSNTSAIGASKYAYAKTTFPII